ncbi:glycosyltransferase family 4 protein [Fulvimarina sp. 2208YS6-2-32]|uniref:Glycosyltransferase family 4 protein n=1 Tax=Fulvimarina uroteuthidis TaxID=3098149 RepID=A0ABU5HWS2_9HYPH|nr:glycosyltransferase family 4 protein [Fulvimarina sp. 2208YS6-2-32]MDY8107542.1 glycosyltransferase family 4 protein [Fulvimarina sp. 2208YS6-2-32]
MNHRTGRRRGSARDVIVIAPNFKRRLSGVTSTIVQLLPLQARRIAIASMGPDVLPAAIPRLPWTALPALWARPREKPFRIWHARRNTEMLPGLVMRDILRMPLRLVFTSAAQREHSAYTRFLIGRMDAVIATSERSGSYLKVPHTVIPHGIDCERFTPDGPMPKLDGKLAAQLKGKRVVGCSGRIRHQKGTDLFVEAMIAVLKDRPDWVAVATGRTTAEHRDFEAGLRRRIAETGMGERILLVGEVDDIAPWFRRFDLYVAPPRNEGFGLTPLEAMASGTPVVATDAGAFRELIVEGVTGSVVDAFTGDAIARAVTPLMDDPAKRDAASHASLAHVRTRFPLAREAGEIAAVYDALWSRENSDRSTRGWRNS